MVQKRFYTGRQPRYDAPGGLEGIGNLPEAVAPQNYGNAPGQKDTGFRYGGVLTYEKPITEFFGDNVLVGPINVVLKPGAGLPNNCVGARFIGLAGTVLVSINGGSYRTLLNGDVLTGCELKSMQIDVAAAGTVNVQVVGTGD